MVKVLLIAILAFAFGGCSGMVYSDVKGAYVDAKVIYSDAKHVVYEIEAEKARIKTDGLGEAQK